MPAPSHLSGECERRKEGAAGGQYQQRHSCAAAEVRTGCVSFAATSLAAGAAGTVEVRAAGAGW